MNRPNNAVDAKVLNRFILNKKNCTNHIRSQYFIASNINIESPDEELNRNLNLGINFKAKLIQDNFNSYKKE